MPIKYPFIHFPTLIISCSVMLMMAVIWGGSTFNNSKSEFSEGALISTISGNVFEDINYGGGDGRPKSTADTHAQSSGWSAGDVGISGVRVEMYDSGGGFLNAVTTDVNGDYSFTGISDGIYQLRVVNTTVTSNRGTNGFAQPTLAVQTFRSNGVTNITNEIGGINPDKIDASANLSNANISTLYTTTTTVQSIVKLAVNNANISGVDFGFNFDLIVNTNDSGQGSLRQFIFNANELDNVNLNQENDPSGGPSVVKDLGWETSLFHISGSGVHTISPASAFTFLRDSFTHLTGYTQVGASQGFINTRNIQIELDGISSSFTGIAINTDNIQVSGLAIHSFTRGISSFKIGSNSTFIWGNYVGVQADGVTTEINTDAGIILQDANSGTVGTNGDNVNDAYEGNLSCLSYAGIELRRCANINLAGNYVGTDKSGSLTGYGNTYIGIMLREATGQNHVGFNDQLSNSDPNQLRNISSGNGTDGVRIFSSDDQVVAGNYIGTDATGMAKIPNNGYGIQFITSASNTIIGTNANGDDDAVEGNIISGNRAGLRVISGATGDNNKITGNYIGVDVTGNGPLGNDLNGIVLEGSFTNSVIGTNGDGINDVQEGNIISDNGEVGIRISSADGYVIAGNNIGVGANGGSAMGNGYEGIFLTGNTNNTIIGYDPNMLDPDEAIVTNIIKNSGRSGIGLPTVGSGNRISRNFISNNASLGIDLGLNDVTVNDNGDLDSGANGFLNFPVIDTALMNSNQMLTLTGFAPAGAAIELFVADFGPNPSPLPAGYTESFGEGLVYILTRTEGSVDDLDATTGTYTNDGTGSTISKTQNRFKFVINASALGLSNQMRLTTTATDTGNNTSEFSSVYILAAAESCFNGMDDDGDGLYDCEDPDCSLFNSDIDNICNFYDIDDDNDGIKDVDEGCGQTTNLLSTIGTSAITNTSYPLTATTVAYNRSGTKEADVNGYAAGTQGHSIRFFATTATTPAPCIGNLTTTFTTGVGNIYFKLTDFDNLEDYTVNVYDENNTLYDLTTAGVILLGTNVIQTNNNFVCPTDEFQGPLVDGNDPVDDPTGSVIFYFPGQVSRISIDYYHSRVSSIRFVEPQFCGTDTDQDGVLNYLDLDSDNDGIFDVDEAGHSASDVNVDGIIDGLAITFGNNGLFDGVETAPDSDTYNYTLSDSETVPDGLLDAVELDSDDDTCFDSEEADATDPDQDGVAGTGAGPPVDANGLVTGITYGHPLTGDWQNPGVLNCCRSKAPILSKN